MVRQISVFLENKEGRLYEVTKFLASEGVDLRALSVADTKDFGVLRLIVDKPDKALNALKTAGYSVRFTEVVAVSLPDRPGELANILGILHENKVNIEYMYTLVSCFENEVVLILRFEAPEAVEKLLRKHGVKVVGEKDIVK
ncbi:amino acid-binding protein [Thermospira aquatica]|uniref:Amino acid-binding protein n=1 Tax=Thermospira aquatica TaxID=2828656 RepID=A0AAX3BB25_9SPIR|nr:amino acid-binding protein [Thermospira aquatica]URA09497.1 amino acid-binding protein [Thermospira aquatica]